MSSSARPAVELVVAVVAALAVSGSVLWTVMAAHENERHRGTEPADFVRRAPFVGMAKSDQLPRSRYIWEAPLENADAFELFNPARIEYRNATGEFAVIPAVRKTESGRNFGVRLVSVDREPLPVQLVGFISEASGGCVGVFGQEGTRAAALVRAGERLEGTAFRVERVESRRGFLGDGGFGEFAIATLVDEESLGVHELNSRERGFTDGAVARIELETEKGVVRAVRGGDRIELRGELYRVGQIVAGAEPSVELVPDGSAAVRDRLVLKPGNVVEPGNVQATEPEDARPTETAIVSLEGTESNL